MTGKFSAVQVHTHKKKKAHTLKDRVYHLYACVFFYLPLSCPPTGSVKEKRQQGGIKWWFSLTKKKTSWKSQRSKAKMKKWNRGKNTTFFLHIFQLMFWHWSDVELDMKDSSLISLQSNFFSLLDQSAFENLMLIATDLSSVSVRFSLCSDCMFNSTLNSRMSCYCLSQNNSWINLTTTR